MKEIRKFIEENGVLLFDGGMGTFYASRNRTSHRDCEWANLSAPGEVEAIHRAYLDVGCAAIKTNTYGANRQNFPEKDCAAIIREGWLIAERAAGDKAYLRSMIDSGKSLIHSIEQRKSTILRIAELIVNAQYDFMKYGPRALKPMTMRQAADKLGLHETTVSRAVSGKYMLTPVGLFEFKYFFSGGFQSEEGEEVSAQAIKNMIRDLVNAEDPAHPLSDSKLSSLLAEKGFEVARRTIAKYREELGISSSQLRKAY